MAQLNCKEVKSPLRTHTGSHVHKKKIYIRANILNQYKQHEINSIRLLKKKKEVYILLLQIVSHKNKTFRIGLNYKEESLNFLFFFHEWCHSQSKFNKLNNNREVEHALLN